MDTCGCCAVRETCQHLRHCQLWIFNAFPSTERTTTDIYIYTYFIFFFSALPPGTVISLSCSLLGHIHPLIKHRAVSQHLAKLRSPGVLISSSNQVLDLTSSWLSGETERGHPRAQGPWQPAVGCRYKLNSKKLGCMAMSTLVNGVLVGGTWWLRTHWPSRKSAKCHWHDMVRCLLPLHSHLSHVLLSMPTCCVRCLCNKAGKL